MTDAGEPSCYEEAVSDKHKNEWLEAIQDEMKSLYENDTFDLVSLPKGMLGICRIGILTIRIKTRLTGWPMW